MFLLLFLFFCFFIFILYFYFFDKNKRFPKGVRSTDTETLPKPLRKPFHWGATAGAQLPFA